VKAGPFSDRSGCRILALIPGSFIGTTMRSLIFWLIGIPIPIIIIVWLITGHA
jgi:hypothetical protein